MSREGRAGPSSLAVEHEDGLLRDGSTSKYLGGARVGPVVGGRMGGGGGGGWPAGWPRAARAGDRMLVDGGLGADDDARARAGGRVSMVLIQEAEMGTS